LLLWRFLATLEMLLPIFWLSLLSWNMIPWVNPTIPLAHSLASYFSGLCHHFITFRSGVFQRSQYQQTNTLEMAQRGIRDPLKRWSLWRPWPNPKS
jgi:hypothetical protein